MGKLTFGKGPADNFFARDAFGPSTVSPGVAVDLKEIGGRLSYAEQDRLASRLEALKEDRVDYKNCHNCGTNVLRGRSCFQCNALP